MSFFLYLILFLLGYWVLKGFIHAFLFYRRVKKAFKSQTNNYNNQRNSQANRSRQQYPHKVFDKSVGEYVDFEEITIQESQTTTQNTIQENDFVAESQVSDAEWEEI